MNEKLKTLLEAFKQHLGEDPMLIQDLTELPPSEDGKTVNVVLQRPIGLVSIVVDNSGVADGFYVYMDPASDAAYAAVLGISLKELADRLGVHTQAAGVCMFVPSEDGSTLNVIYDTKKVYEAYASLFTNKAKELGVG